MLDRNQLTSDLLTDYALGFLNPLETSEVEAALERYPDVRFEVSAYLDGLTDLVMDLDPAPVPAGAADRLMARLNAEGPIQDAPEHSTESNTEPGHLASRPGVVAQPGAERPQRNRLYPLIALAAAVAVGVVVIPGLNRNQSEFTSHQTQPGAVNTTLKNKAGAPLADVVRLPNGQAYVQMRSALPTGRAYQAWKIEGGKPVSLGMFKGREYGAALPAGTVFAVTVEPEGGSQQPTTTPLFAQPI